MIAFRLSVIIATLMACSCEVHVITDSTVHHEDHERDGVFLGKEIER